MRLFSIDCSNYNFIYLDLTRKKIFGKNLHRSRSFSTESRYVKRRSHWLKRGEKFCKSKDDNYIGLNETDQSPLQSSHSSKVNSSCETNRKESDLDEVRQILKSALKNSLNHVHDHIIASLPTEMSIYYQKMSNLYERGHDSVNDSVVNPRACSESIDRSRKNPSPNPENTETESSSNDRVAYNPYAPPSPKPAILPIREFLHDPLNASTRTLNQVSNLVRIPTSSLIYDHGINFINNLVTPVTFPANKTRPPGTAERVHTSDDETGSIPIPPPNLPLIECTFHQSRKEPLSLEEFEQSDWTIETLRLRVFQGGISDELRPRIWPWILGLADDEPNNQDITKEFDWTLKEKLYEHFRMQWQSILPDQEKQRDVIRCDRTHPFYKGDQNKNLHKLKELLLTYMIYDFDTGYVQGMSDLASPLLYIMQGDTCKAFWFFAKIMEFTNNNFEMSQKTIKNQLEMLWKLIELTDPIFAQYLANNDSVNCYFAFRWIVCQFKREFMKQNSDDYQEILLLWESIWTCSSMNKHLIGKKPDQRKRIDIDAKVQTPKDDCKDQKESDILTEKFESKCHLSDEQNNLNNKSIQSEKNHRNETQSIDLPQHQQGKLSVTELYVLCICLSIIRRERDLIMVQRFDATEILKHFNTLELTKNLNDILLHAANIWSWLIFDENDKFLFGIESEQSKSIENITETATEIEKPNQSIDSEDFDLLQDLRLPVDRQIPSNEDFFIFNNI
ncbi:TBC1 domain family member 15-like protein [Sarcoptes scabiei]|uniref:TBC1 domain family member 15-like protein n=1 Tax=Sarcoptes scabiei TaxID=52283 RepID=A0A131ZT21_SARSC|nr:TBC1 domain family member 15-like protein [Sarcoptes scabiei]